MCRSRRWHETSFVCMDDGAMLTYEHGLRIQAIHNRRPVILMANRKLNIVVVVHRTSKRARGVTSLIESSDESLIGYVALRMFACELELN